MTAAAPQVGGQAMERVITPGHITFSAITSSTLTTFRNTAFGFFAAWRLALARMAAKVSIFVPYFFMCVRPAPPNRRRARGISILPSVSSSTALKSSSGLGRSSKGWVSAPGGMNSKPKASATSTTPLCTAWRARNRALEPVEQLLLTLRTGMPVMPTL
ncbi:hypothetical protein D9M68_788850 [compost metagenome]